MVAPYTNRPYTITGDPYTLCQLWRYKFNRMKLKINYSFTNVRQTIKSFFVSCICPTKAGENEMRVN